MNAIVTISLLVQAASIPAVPTAPQTVPLWRDFHTGMTFEQTAEALRNVEGVKEVKVKLKKKVPTGLQLSYVSDGITVANHTFVVVPVFANGFLDSIALANERCVSIATEQGKLLSTSLKEKYQNTQTETVVDENNVRQDRRLAFWNNDTRVRLSMTIVPPPKLEYQDESAGGFVGGLAKLANSMNRTAVDDAMTACPDDAGYKFRTTILYSPQASFLTEHKAETDEADRQAKARRDGL